MMTQNTEDTSTAPPQVSGGSRNRYILLAVLAVVAVVTIFLLKKNMEPPPARTSAGQGTPTAESGQEEPSREQMMQEIMSQIEHVKGILAQDSSNFDAWTALGNMYFDIGMSEDAITHYQAALAIKPDDLNVMTDMATMLRSTGKPEEAIGILTRVVDIDSTMAQAWFNLGVIYSFDLKDSKNALTTWKRFVALNPNSEHSEAIMNEIQRLEKEFGS